jgi:hypothetical protein
MSNDFFFFPELNPAEQGIVPVPPEEMRFLELRAEPVIDDGPLRLRVYVEVTAFQKRPYIEVALLDANGDELASASVIEPMQRKNVFTMHIRSGQKSGKFSLHARMYYPEGPESDQAHSEFEI